MSTSSNKNLEGINIQDALSILSLRAKSRGEREFSDEANPDKKRMGQTINLFQADNIAEGENSVDSASVSKSNGCDCVRNTAAINAAPTLKETAEEETKRQQMESERKERELKFKRELETLSVKELLHAILGVQKERVVTYKEFDSGLDKVLQTRNISTYPTACAKATASFSVLSSSINTMNDILFTKKKLYHKMILQLQLHEKEKLNVTAALHLEQIRKNDYLLNIGVDENDGTLRLLNEGIKSLKSKMSICIENINDLIDELKCEMMEEED